MLRLGPAEVEAVGCIAPVSHCATDGSLIARPTSGPSPLPLSRCATLQIQIQIRIHPFVMADTRPFRIASIHREYRIMTKFLGARAKQLYPGRDRDFSSIEPGRAHRTKAPLRFYRSSPLHLSLPLSTTPSPPPFACATHFSRGPLEFEIAPSIGSPGGCIDAMLIKGRRFHLESLELFCRCSCFASYQFTPSRAADALRLSILFRSFLSFVGFACLTPSC